MKKNGLFGELIGEVFGTFILILLGDGVVANVGLAPRLAAGGYDWNTITIGWAFAVIVGGTVLAVGLSRWAERLFYQPSS
jgi:glycerol uptake facilitator protein